MKEKKIKWSDVLWPVFLVAAYIIHGLYQYLDGSHVGLMRGLRASYQAAYEIADEDDALSAMREANCVASDWPS